jgi:hypothetical protein
VGRKGQTAEEESKEHYPITVRGLRDPFSTGKFDGIFGGDEAVRRGLLHLLLCDGGANPVGDSSAPAQSAFRGFAREEETEEISNGGGGGNELVNSMIPHYAIYISSGRRIVG